MEDTTTHEAQTQILKPGVSIEAQTSLPEPSHINPASPDQSLSIISTFELLTSNEEDVADFGEKAVVVLGDYGFSKR